METESYSNSAHFESAQLSIGDLRTALETAETNILQAIEELDAQALHRKTDHLECTAL